MSDDITVLYEDDDCVVINKPAGLVTHPDGKTQELSVVDWVLEKYPDIKGIGEDLILSNGTVVYRPGIVHRLDRETSGVLLVAKTQEGYAHLKEQFQERIVTKTYRAFVYGKIKEDRGAVHRPIGRSKKDFRKWSANNNTRGKERPASTVFSVITRNNDVTYVTVVPKTGRTHQIRVHMKTIHHPVVCDSLYAPKQPCLLGFERLALHAFVLEFQTVTGRTETVIAPLPRDFTEAEKRLREL